MHDVATYPPLYDWDASAHAVNVIDLMEMHLPNPHSWGGSHPPLYHAVGAALWGLCPESVPVHVILRSVSAGAWVATVWLVWRSLRRLRFGVDAAIAAALLLGVPGFVIASCMMTNDALCVLFMTAALVRLLEAPRGETPDARGMVLTSVLAALAALTKASGLAAIGMVALFYAWRSRRRPFRAVRNVLLVGLVSAAIVGPHYARLSLLFARSTNLSEAPKTRYHIPLYDLLAGFSESEEKEAISLVVLAAMRANESRPSSLSLLHEAIWADPTSVFLPADPRIPVRLLSTAGLILVGLVAGGVVRLLVRRNIAKRAGVVCVFGLLYAAAITPPSLAAPYLILTKTNFLLPLVLPIGLVLAVGLDGLRGGVRTALRGTVLLIAAAGVAVTWYGWWEPEPPPSRPLGVHDGTADPVLLTVQRYFAYRASDPIRALRLLAPEVHRTHELRLVRILRVPFTPRQALASEDEQSLDLARARQAWLELYNLIRWIQPIAAAMQANVLEVDQQPDTAEVRVRVEAIGTAAPPGASGISPWPFPAFDQRFSLRRAGAGWQIARIEQSGVSPENAVPAFVADPTLASLDDLRALGWRPSWEDTFASMPSPDGTGRER